MEQTYVRELNIDKVDLWKDKSRVLSGLDIELTERCNNNCIHCYINLPADNLAIQKRELSTEEIKNILREAASLCCISVRFTGGEPLLREDFQELYIFARRLGLKVILFTNATLIESSLIKLFKCIPPLEKIEVTIYGMRKASYEAVTRAYGSYDSAWKGINLLLENRIPFVVKAALFPANETEVEEFDAFAATIPWMDKPLSYTIFFDLRCRRGNTEKNKLIKKIRRIPEDGIKILARRQTEYLKEMRDFCSKFISPAGGKLFYCGAGIGGGCVDAYGYLQPCMMLRHPDTVYDLRKGTLKDALINFFPKVRQMKATNSGYLLHCANCFLKGLCGQCPAKSWMEYGTLDTPVEYFCEIAHAQARHLGLLKENEMGWEVKKRRERIEEFCAKELMHEVKGRRVI